MTVLDAFLGRSTIKRSTASRAGSTIRNARRMYSEKDDVVVAERKVLEIEEEIEALAETLEEEIDKLNSNFEIENYEIEEFYIKPRRSDITDVEMLLLWESRV
jgi:phosphoribosylformylglycinamidine (FGAM) synthase PurS component